MVKDLACPFIVNYMTGTKIMIISVTLIYHIGTKTMLVSLPRIYLIGIKVMIAIFYHEFT